MIIIPLARMLLMVSNLQAPTAIISVVMVVRHRSSNCSTAAAAG